MDEKKMERSPCMIDLQTAKNKSGLSYYTLRALTLSGKIPAIRIGGKKGKIMVNGKKLEEYLSNAKLGS